MSDKQTSVTDDDSEPGEVVSSGLGLLWWSDGYSLNLTTIITSSSSRPVCLCGTLGPARPLRTVSLTGEQISGMWTLEGPDLRFCSRQMVGAGSENWMF